MSKALAVLKLFFSLVSFNTTVDSPTTSYNHTNSTIIPTTGLPVMLIKPMDPIASFVGQAFKFKVPYDTFYPTHDARQKENLKLSMSTVNDGKISPKAWLRFDPKSRSVFCFPLDGNEGVFGYLVTATNADGKFAKDVLNIHVRANGGRYNHEFVITAGFSLASFISNVLERYEFISRLARYSLRKDISTVWLKSYNKQLKQLTIAFNTIEYEPCAKKALQELRDKFVTQTGKVRPSLQKALTMKYPVTRVELRFLGPCVPPPTTPKPPFEWGILKHLMPLLMMLMVIGLPLSISCIIHKRSKKQRAKVRDQLRKKKREEEMDFTFHTVHYNNRYPSMLSMSNNSKEEDTTTGDEERSSNTKINVVVPNGNVPSSPSMNGPTNTINNQNKNVNTDVHTNVKADVHTNVNTDVHTNINTHVHTNVNTTKVNATVNTNVNDKPSRIIYMGKSDMNIPVYFTKPKEVQKDTEMSFHGIAESISSTIKGLGKSVLNIAGQGEEVTPTTEEKVNNVNVAGTVTTKDDVACSKPVLLSSELQLPLAPDAELTHSKRFSVRSIETETGRIGIPKRSKSELRLSDLEHHPNFKEEYEMFNEHSNFTGTLMRQGNMSSPQRGLSMPHLDIRSTDNYEYTAMNTHPHYEVESHCVSSLKSCFKTSEPFLTNTMDQMNEQLPMINEGMVIGNLTHQIEQMSREVCEDFGSQKASQGIQYSTQQHGGEPVHEYVEEEDLAINDEEAMDYTTWRIRQIKKAEREAQQKQSLMHSEEYPTEMFADHGLVGMATDHGQIEMAAEHGLVGMAADYGQIEMAVDHGLVGMATNHGQIEMAVDHGYIEMATEHGLVEVAEHGYIENTSLDHEAEVYEDYTNPYQYANGASLTGRSQSTYFTTQNWSEDYEKENRYKQQPPSSPLYARHNTHSMPSLIDHNHTGYFESKVDNRTKTPADDKSLIGKLFTREKTVQNRNLHVQDESVDDGSLVGFLKTRVGGILGPSEGASSWFK